MKEKNKSYVVKILEIKEKTENKKEQDLIQEAYGRYVEILLGNSMELNIELADILEETDQTVEEYRKENDNLRQKLWKAIQKLRDKNAEVNDIEQELEVAKDEIEELYEKLHQTN